MSTMFFIQFAIVLLCILIGAQVGGIGLGVLGGVGLAVLAFGFHLEPTSRLDAGQRRFGLHD